MEEPFQHRSDCADPDCLCQPCVGDDRRAGNRAIGRPNLSRRSGEVFLDDRPRLPMTGKPLSGPPLSCRRCAAFSLSPWRRWCLTAGFRTCFFRRMRGSDREAVRKAMAESGSGYSTFGSPGWERITISRPAKLNHQEHIGKPAMYLNIASFPIF